MVPAVPREQPGLRADPSVQRGRRGPEGRPGGARAGRSLGSWAQGEGEGCRAAGFLSVP